MDKTELRCDPLTEEWTVFNEARALPPEHTSILGEELAPSPFRAGLERYASHALHTENGPYGWQVRVVPNRLPILRVEGDHQPNSDMFYQHLDGVGAHEIVVEDPGDRAFDQLPQPALVQVLQAWRSRLEDLRRDVRLRSFAVVKDAGRAAGQTIAHSLSQVFALAIIPPALRRLLDRSREYYRINHRSLFADLLEQEQRRAVRLVYENPGYVVFCPYASRAPFEIAIWPKRQSADFHLSNHDELTLLADALQQALARLNRALQHPAYHLTLTTAPARDPQSTEWPTMAEDFRWHLSIVPQLRPGGGFEMATGCHVNGVWPEIAAEYLRREESAARHPEVAP
jgi:UDPglucose--hexose-1-phosphate uridylyltransferase